jgi:hypothetical protein
MTAPAGGSRPRASEVQGEVSAAPTADPAG